MDDGEDYVRINVDILRSTSQAIQARCADNIPRWIPRSLIYGPDEKTSAGKIGEMMTLRVFRWFAAKNAIPIARQK